MAYCPECGTEVSADAQFCPDCGTGLQSEEQGENQPTHEAGESESVEGATSDDEGIDTGRAVVSGVMGIIVGAIVAFAFTNIGGSSILFVVTVLGVGYFLYSREKTGKAAVGMGLYITALWMPLAPIIFYIPLAGGANPDTAAGAGQAIGSVLGMFIYGFIGLIIGLILAVIGYFLRRGEGE